MKQLDIWPSQYKVAYKEYIEIYEHNTYNRTKFQGYDKTKWKWFHTKGLMTLPEAMEFAEFISTMTWGYAGQHYIVDVTKKSQKHKK